MVQGATSMNEDNKSFWIQMGYASSVGFAMVLAIFGSLIIGTYLDGKFGTGHLLTLLLMLIGIVVGFRNIYILIKKNFPNDERLERNIKNEPHRKRPPPKKT